MAVRDVREYYYTMQAQLLEMKADLADFEEALKNGYITEDKMQVALEEVAALQLNYDRLTYIMYLLEMPARKTKKAKYNKANKALVEEFKNRKADIDSVVDENKSALDAFRAELKKLKNEK